MTDLNERETEKLIAIKKVLVGEYTKKEASVSLGLTIRQIDRLINKLKDEGEKGFVHKNRGKESKRKISDEIKKKLLIYILQNILITILHIFLRRSRKNIIFHIRQ